MKVYFSVDCPKIQKRKINRGEDAPVVNKDGVMIACDGTGATGQSEHTLKDGEVYTSAYLGSRETSKIAEEFLLNNYDSFISAFENFDELQKVVMQLGKSIQKGLKAFAISNKLELTVYGKSFKLLPTTFTAIVYKAYETKIDAIILSAGDSPALWWDSQGLHRLAAEDFGAGISFGDCSINNCISADSDFKIYFSCYRLPSKGMFLASSDGFTDPIKPFDQERYLIEWIGNFEGISEQNSSKLSDTISCKLDEMGFTKRDDCSIAGVIVGYESEDELKNDFRKRYKNELVQAYLKPYQSVNNKYNEAEINLNNAEIELQKVKDKVIRIIRDGILAYVSTISNISVSKESEFQSLINSDAINWKINEENSRIERDTKEKQDQYEKAETELHEKYLEFSKMLCRNYGSVRFSEELRSSVVNCYKQENLLKECSNNIKIWLKRLKSIPEPCDEICDKIFLNSIADAAKGLTENSEILNNNYDAYLNDKNTIERYFNYQNNEIRAFFYEDIENNFAILKKLFKMQIFPSKKEKELKMLSIQVMNLYEFLEETKNQLTDEFIEIKKLKSYKRIIANFCNDIAHELFENNNFECLILEDAQTESIPEMVKYQYAKKRLTEALTERDSVLEGYNVEYCKYLSNTTISGTILIEKENN